MASSVPPVKGSAYTTEIALVSQGDTDIFQTSVTLAAGDVVVYQDGVLDGNIDTLPVEIGSSGVLTVVLSGAEMTADRVVVKFSDVAGSEWQDALLIIHTVARRIDDLAYPNTSGRGIDVDASGGVEVGAFQAGALAEVNAEVDSALADLNLDHLLSAACDGDDITQAVVDNSVMAFALAIDGDISDYDDDTDSQEGIAAVLSNSEVTTVAVVDGDTVSVRRDTRWAFSLTGAGDISGRMALYFTVKNDLENDADSEAILQLEETAGLLYVDGAAATAAGNGALTVDDANAGDFSVAVEVAELTGGTRGEYTWGLKMIDADGPTMMAKGVFRRGYAVARATS